MSQVTMIAISPSVTDVFSAFITITLKMAATIMGLAALGHHDVVPLLP